jgi:hypothetical protein
MTYTLEDYLVGLHTGQWFGFGNSENKTYANLVIHSDDAKPTEQECIDGVTALQTEYDSLAYARSRKQEYDKLNQWEMQFDDNRDGTTTWVDSINEIKQEFPK